jgi:hypothetical protein
MQRIFILLVLSLFLIAPQLRAQSLEATSARFLGLPYGFGGPLGEGELDIFDQDPLYRFDVFDCTTYIETVLALSAASDEAGNTDMIKFSDRMSEIRYHNARVSYFDRNHFVELDWNPNNIKAGFFTDITAQVAGKSLAFSTAIIDKRGWYNAKTSADIKPERGPAETELLLQQLRALGANIEAQSVSLPYLPLATLLGPDGNTLDPEILSRLPDHSVINVVRQNWKPSEATALIVSHQMFLFKIDGQFRLRHASPSRGVTEMGLAEYFKPYLNSPTVRGINILRIN